MVLKKASIASALALTVGVSTAIGATSAAPASTAPAASAVTAPAAPKASAIRLADTAYVVNGAPVTLKTFVEKGRTLASLSELKWKLGFTLQSTGGAYTATLNDRTVELADNSNVMKVNGAERKLSVPVKKVYGIGFVDLNAFVSALGGLVDKDASGASRIVVSLLPNVDHVQWANPTGLIASQETETGRIDYYVDVTTGKYVQLSIPADASELVVAPNGTKAAYTNAAGEVFVIDFNTKSSSQLSSDTAIKPELVWSADSSVLYFLQGDKGSVIAKLEPGSGAITKILEDKVDYKSNLNVSADGKTLIYAVTKPGTVVADSAKPVDSDDVTIDTNGTEPQYFAYANDPSLKDNKPVQWTASTDDKVFAAAAADGLSLIYVSVSEEPGVKSTLVRVNKDKTTQTLFGDKDIFKALQSGGKWYLLTEGDGTNQFIYEVDPTTGAANRLYTVTEAVSDIVVAEGAPFAVISSGIVYVDRDGHWKQATR